MRKLHLKLTHGEMNIIQQIGQRTGRRPEDAMVTIFHMWLQAQAARVQQQKEQKQEEVPNE